MEDWYSERRRDSRSIDYDDFQYSETVPTHQKPVMFAYCTSPICCTYSDVRLIRKHNVMCTSKYRRQFECPDCGYALYWRKKEIEEEEK